MNTSGNLLKSYGYAPGSGWSTDPLFMKVVSPPAGSEQSAVFSYLYFHNDALGTPHALTDKAGQIVWSAQYDEFGAAQIASTGGTSSTSSTVCNLRFPGQYFDAETGLHYNFHRYYDPALGRYITEDPIRDGLNWYAYAGSNPGDMVDPLGLMIMPDPCNNDWMNPFNWAAALWYSNSSVRREGHRRHPGVQNSGARHRFGAGEMAYTYGPTISRTLGVGNEVQGFLWHDIWDLDARIRGQRPWAFEWDDLMENEEGIKEGTKRRCPEKKDPCGNKKSGSGTKAPTFMPFFA